MNFATMLSGSWKQDLAKIRCKNYDIGKARKTRTENKASRQKQTIGYIESGKSIEEMAEIFNISIRTLRLEVIKLGKEGTIDSKIAKKLTTGNGVYSIYEEPTENTRQKRNMIFFALVNKSMTYAEISNFIGLSRPTVYSHVMAMEKDGIIIKLPCRPARFTAVRP